MYLILNIVLIKLEEFTELHSNLRKPKRLTMSSLSRIIIDKLSAFKLFQNKKQFITRDVQTQTDLPEGSIQLQDGDCQSCIVLFKHLNTITDKFEESISFINLKNAR